MRCDNCARDATQIREEYQLCDRCYTVSFSSMTIDGKKMKVPAALKFQLEKMGLGRKEDESIADWGSRCRAWASKTPYGKILEGKT